MTTSRFRCLAAPDEGACVCITVDGRPLDVPAGISLAAALLAGGVGATRSTPVSGAPRAPYCMMGVCFDCLVEVDGRPNRQACLVPVQAGMQVQTQQGARALGAVDEAGRP
jgi:predicted molibdopterin-dependent oxidoreductase YjgC